MADQPTAGLTSARRIGTVVHLQIQRERLIQAHGDGKIYRTEPLQGVAEMLLTSRGVLGRVNDGWMLDRHHDDHPTNPNSDPRRALSVGFTSHYAAMAERFGRAEVGVAGENLIVETDGMVQPETVAGGFEIHTPSHTIVLRESAIAEPCVHFTRFLLGRPDAPLEDVKEPRNFLRNGMRGFVMALEHLDTPVTVRAGAEVWAHPAG